MRLLGVMLFLLVLLLMFLNVVPNLTALFAVYLCVLNRRASRVAFTVSVIWRDFTESLHQSINQSIRREWAT